MAKIIVGAAMMALSIATMGVMARDIFHYVYAVLHHPEYRQRYAANLKRKLPRIPVRRQCGAGVPITRRA